MRIDPSNLISLFRVLLVFVAVFLLIEVGGTRGTFLATLLVTFAVLLDAIDGMVARALGFKGEVGKLLDLYADHIIANLIWVTLAFLGCVSVWVPLITTTRDLFVDYFRQTGAYHTGLNGFEQVEKSRFRWMVSSRTMRALYGGLKLCSWGGILFSILLPINFPIELIVWTAVVVCLLRALPSLSSNWKYTVFYKPAV